MVLYGQAVLFYLPGPIWRVLSKGLGLTISTVVDSAVDCQRQKSIDSKKILLNYMTKQIGLFLNNQSNLLKTYSKYRLLKIFINYKLTLFYIIIKIIYLINVVIQLVFLNMFVGGSLKAYGLQSVLNIVSKGYPWSLKDHFPGTILCNLEIHTDDINVQKYTIQCDMPANKFIEKVFIIMWIWLVFITTMTSSNFSLFSN